MLDPVLAKLASGGHWWGVFLIILLNLGGYICAAKSYKNGDLQLATVGSFILFVILFLLFTWQFI